MFNSQFLASCEPVSKIYGSCSDKGEVLSDRDYTFLMIHDKKRRFQPVYADLLVKHYPELEKLVDSFRPVVAVAA